MTDFHRVFRRPFIAGGKDEGAAPCKYASLRKRGEVWYLALDRSQAARCLAAACRVAFEQKPRIGMGRPMKHVSYTAALNDFAGVHDDHSMAKLGNKSKMMRNEENAATPFFLKLLQEVDDLNFERRIERRRRLIGDQQSGLSQHRHGDCDALAHAA